MKNKLEFSEFKINMIYGFTTNVKSEEKFKNWLKHNIQKERKKTNTKPELPNGIRNIRNGWSSSYQINSGVSKVSQFSFSPKNTNQDESDEINMVSDIRKWPSSISELKGKISRFITIRNDGTGTITLAITFEEKGIMYHTSDILQSLSCVPRTLHPKKDDFPTIRETLACPDIISKKNKKCWELLSYPFQLFVTTMLDIEKDDSGLEWVEVETDNEESDRKIFFPEHTFPIYGNLEFSTDPQIPYFYVFGTIPYKQYEKAFLEKTKGWTNTHKNRKIYTKEIAAILSRWLLEGNIPYISLEYWEQRGMIQDSIFMTKYMNSIIFTTFSELLTLSFYPDLEELKLKDKKKKELMGEPTHITYPSILRCLEFSRMRWHNAIWLSKQFDFLIKKVVEQPGTRDVIPLLNRLIILAEKIALHLEDPSSYLWDAEVGSHIAKFLHEQITENLEKEISKKLVNSRDLLNDKLKEVRTLDYARSILKL